MFDSFVDHRVHVVHTQSTALQDAAGWSCERVQATYNLQVMHAVMET